MVGECMSLPLSYCEKKQMSCHTVHDFVFCGISAIGFLTYSSATPSVDFTSARRTWLYPFTTSLKTGFAAAVMIFAAVCVCTLPFGAFGLLIWALQIFQPPCEDFRGFPRRPLQQSI
jgi:nitrate reductase NapE component